MHATGVNPMVLSSAIGTASWATPFYPEPVRCIMHYQQALPINARGVRV